MKKILAASLLMLLHVVVMAQSKVTISGYVTDVKSAETIIGATIYDVVTRHGTASNVFGFYSITLNAGEHTLQFSYVGCQTKRISLSLKNDTVINVQLSANVELAEVVVEAKSREVGIESAKMGSIDIPVKLIEHTPSLLGETDVLRTIQMTPGVQQGVGGASSLYVRGGNGDENLVLLDGAPVYKIDHLFGFFSVFTPDAVKKVTFYKSSFPARYNGRTSSVIDVRTKDGDMNEYHGSASIGLLTSRFNFEGPIAKGKTSFCLSGRTTYISALTKPFMKDYEFSYWFYDVNLKLNHKFSDHDRLYFALYNGLDKMKSDDTDDEFGTHSVEIGNDVESRNYVSAPITNNYGGMLKWRNFIPSIRWNHIFSSRLFANTTVNYNHYKMAMSSYDDYNWRYDTLRGFEYNSAEYNSEIEDYGAIVDFDYLPLPAHTIKFGGNYTYHNFVPETANSVYKTESGDDIPTDTSAVVRSTTIYANEVSFYVDDDWKLADNLNINVGVAYTLFALKSKKYHNFNPRLSVKYMLLDFLTIKASYSRMSQCVHLLTSSPIALPTDLWVPITDEIKPEVANQYGLGLYLTKWQGWEVSVEGYYKKLSNVLEYKDGMSFMGFSGSWTSLVAPGEGESRGIEFMIQKNEGRLTGMLSYTLSKTDRKFSRGSGVNDGRRFPFAYDRRHNLNIVANYQLTNNIELDATWTFHSGACATITNAKQQIIEPDVMFGNPQYSNYAAEQPIYTEKSAEYVPERNNYRLPCSHVLCMGINFHKQKKRYERIFNLSVYNLYNAMNPSLIYYKHYDADGNELDKPKLTKITILPIIPSFTLTYKF